jgi:alanine-synthesizing transaminase
VQLAAERLLSLGEGIGRQIAARVGTNLRVLLEGIPAGSPVAVEPADGGWSAVLRVPAIRSEEELVLLLLQEDGVLVHPGFFFDFPREAYVVVSLLPQPTEFRAGLDRLLHRAAR